MYLCFVPHEQRWLVYGDIDVYVVNFTPHRIIYSLLLAKEGCGFVSQDFGSLEAEEKVLIGTISREQIDSWKKGCMQLLFHDDKMQNVLLPINCELKVRTNRFFTEGSFIENAFFAEKAIVYPLCTMLSVGVFMQGEVAEIEECKDKSEEPIVETIYKNVTDTFLHKHLSGRSTAEVDLHINELVEDVADNTAITIGADYTASAGFARGGLILANRLPLVPAGGDNAIDRTVITDPVSGISFEVAVWGGAYQNTMTFSTCWGWKNIKGEHSVALLG